MRERPSVRDSGMFLLALGRRRCIPRWFRYVYAWTNSRNNASARALEP
jgi:hypothetical protein